MAGIFKISQLRKPDKLIAAQSSFLPSFRYFKHGFYFDYQFLFT